MDHLSELLTLAAEYQRATGLSQARVSTLVRNDGKFLKTLEAGASCTMRTYASVVQWFADHWPEQAVWPAAIKRPEQAAQTDAAA